MHPVEITYWRLFSRDFCSCWSLFCQNNKDTTRIIAIHHLKTRFSSDKQMCVFSKRFFGWHKWFPGKTLIKTIVCFAISGNGNEISQKVIWNYLLNLHQYYTFSLFFELKNFVTWTNHIFEFFVSTSDSSSTESIM